MRSRFLFPVSMAFTALVLAACGMGERVEVPRKPLATSLVERWSEVEIVQATAPEPQARRELRFDGEGTEASWRTVSGVADLRVEDGLLHGRSTSETPIFELEITTPLGTDDELWSVELRLRVSAGTRAGVHPLRDPGPPRAAVVARAGEWPLSTPLVAGEETKTYTVVLDRVFTLELPLAETDVETILVRPTDVAGAEFAIESLRLVFRKERLASIDSGPGWHGLGEVFRETLVSRAPEALRFRVALPERPWLDLAVGTVEATPPRFRVALEAGGKTETLAELEVEEAESWRAARLDLGRWAGEVVTLELAAEGSPGALAFWGAPTVRSSIAGDPPRPQAVVVFLADTLRRDHLDAWGHERPTAPTLTRLASEGVRFSDAIAQSTWTKASVPSLLTSLYPATTGVHAFNDRVPAAETTLAEAFREAGYATFSTSSVPFSGQLTNLHQGVEVLYEFGAGAGAGEYRSKTARRWVDAYLEWLELHSDVPTFAFVHAMDPHSPFRPEPPWDEKWIEPGAAERFEEQAERVRPHIASPLLQRFLAPSREELERAGVDAESFVAHERAWYDASIRAMDAELERLLGRLEELGLTDRALLAFASDHGEEFLEHGRHWHGQTLYGEVTNVPLVLWGQGVPAGRVVEQTVQNVDLMPTLLELAGLEVPERAQGRSLVPLFDGPGPDRPAFAELRRGDQDSTYAVVDGGWKLVWRPGADGENGELELYDHATDPLDLQNVAARHPDVAERLAAELRRWRQWAENRRLDPAAQQDELSAEQLEQLRSLGYLD